METTLELKKELHDLIEEVLDEEVLKSIHTLLRRERKLNGKRKPDLSAKPEVAKSNIQYLTLPNGKTIPIEPRDPSVSMDELFGIWKDNPITIEELRQKAWGGRL